MNAGINRPRPRNIAGSNPALRNRTPKAQGSPTGQGPNVVPVKLSKDSMDARRMQLRSRAMAAKAMKGGMA